MFVFLLIGVFLLDGPLKGKVPVLPVVFPDFSKIFFKSSFRPCLKNVKTPKRRIFSHHSALIFLAIHKVCLRQIALIDEKISRRWAFRQFSNKA